MAIYCLELKLSCFFVFKLWKHPYIDISNGYLTLGQTDLTTHLMFQGVHQEHKSGRTPLPRNIMLTVDKDEEGKDLIKMENIKERLRAQNIVGLKLLNFTPEDSFKNEFLQMTDLLTASLNRLINFPGKQTVKDEFATHLLRLLNVDLGVFQINNYKKSLLTG